MDVFSPRTLDEALRLRAERPGAVPIEGGTDLMVDLNFDRRRPDAMLNLNEVSELRGWSRESGSLRLGAGLTFTEIEHSELATLLPALAEASRTVGSPQIRNRGTIGGNLGTASPAGDALPPLLIERAEIELASVRGTRRLPLTEFLVGPKRNALAEDELIVAVHIEPSGAAQTFMKIGPRNAMVIAVCSLALERRPRAQRSPRRIRVGRPGCDARHRGAGRIRRSSRCSLEPDRRRAWHGRVSTARAARARSARTREVHGRVKISLMINGERREADVWEGESLLFALRERLGLPGSKNACEQGECGSCSVILDGELVCACLVLAAQADGHEVVTVEGPGFEHVQQAFVEAGAVQCGFCTPGLVVATAALLGRIPDPSEDEIREALSGNLCRCTGYAKIFDAVRLAAERA